MNLQPSMHSLILIGDEGNGAEVMTCLHIQGLLLAKGPGIMKGYFNDEAATAKAFSAGNGWFNTGDLGWRAPSACLYDFPVIVLPASLPLLH